MAGFHLAFAIKFITLAYPFKKNETLMLPIATPITIRNTVFKNRIIKGAMSEALANDAGQPNLQHLALYDAWGEGGLGCAITGNVMVDIRAKNEPGVVAVESDRDIELLKEWAAIGKQHNMIQLIQLSHPGRQCPKGIKDCHGDF